MSDQVIKISYLEHTAGHSKFYEVNTLESATGQFSITTRHGRIGQNGRVIKIPLSPNAPLATVQAMAQSIVEGKIAKGYVLKVQHTQTTKPSEHTASRFSRLNLE